MAVLVHGLHPIDEQHGRSIGRTLMPICIAMCLTAAVIVAGEAFDGSGALP
jgi:hypothetical protein